MPKMLSVYMLASRSGRKVVYFTSLKRLIKFAVEEWFEMVRKSTTPEFFLQEQPNPFVRLERFYTVFSYELNKRSSVKTHPVEELKQIYEKNKREF